MTSTGGRPPLILASASPRRRELLAMLGVEFDIEPADIDELAPERHQRAERLARHLAREKALVVSARRPDAVVLAADTIVVQRGRLLAKPVDASEAREMLEQLRGRDHRVISGVTVARGRRASVAHAVTHVRMRRYADSEVDRYIQRGEPFDKAGGYAIQDAEFAPVERFNGCHCNVVGLPLALVIRLLVRHGVLVPVREPSHLTPQCRCCPLFPTTTP